MEDNFYKGSSCVFWRNEEFTDWGVAQFLHFLFRPRVLASYPGKVSVVPAGTERNTKCSVSSETPSQEATFELHNMLAIKQQVRAELRVLLWFPRSGNYHAFTPNPSWPPSKEQWSCRAYWTVGCVLYKSLLRVLIEYRTVKWRKRASEFCSARVGQKCGDLNSLYS